MLSIYNSLSKQKEEFIPLNPDHVKFYSCGPTVYNKIHIGNARAFISADLLSKVLKGNNRGEYFLWISHDSAPYLEDGYRTWFYFSVHGVPQGEQLTFTFKKFGTFLQDLSQKQEPPIGWEMR